MNEGRNKRAISSAEHATVLYRIATWEEPMWVWKGKVPRTTVAPLAVRQNIVASHKLTWTSASKVVFKKQRLTISQKSKEIRDKARQLIRQKRLPYVT